jgi:concentrative nucleoside transporter, CNT family
VPPLLPHLQSALGLLVIVAIAWAFSENRRAFPVRAVLTGVGLQIALALLLLKIQFARDALFSLNGAVDALMAATRAGTSFVFGYAGGAPPPFAVTNPAGLTSFAFQILPLVIVISALSALLWYWRVLPLIVGGFAWALRKTMGIGGAVGLGSAATIFLGMIEAPLLIRPYLAKLSRSELFMLFTVGLATVAGTVFVLYATILSPAVPGALGHILVASVLSLPAAILIARVMIPGVSETEAGAAPGFEYRSSMDAVARGTEDGLKLWLSIVAMLLVIVALVALADIILAHFPAVFGAPLTMERIFGWIFAPFVWLLGIPWDQTQAAGALMGDKTVLNEFIAYLKLASLPADALEPRSRLIMLYALCGFANFGSVGIMIASISALVPERRAEIVPLAMRALVSGTLASAMTGAVIGLLPVA